jgi:hypothetical protein
MLKENQIRVMIYGLYLVPVFMKMMFQTAMEKRENNDAAPSRMFSILSFTGLQETVVIHDRALITAR